MLSLIVFKNILYKDMKAYYFKPPNISWGLLFPISWTLMFLLRTDTAVVIKDLLPGLISLAILFGTTSMLAVTITFEKKQAAFDRLLLAPISLNTLMFAKTSGAILFGIFNALVPLLLASFFTDLSGFNFPAAVAAIILISITSTFLGLFIAVSVKEVFEAQTYSNFIRFPMIFLCGLFFPIAEFPFPVRIISYFLPLTYGNDILKYAILSEHNINLVISYLYLIIFALLLFYISIRNIKNKWIK